MRKCYGILTGLMGWANGGELLRFHAMSAEQLITLLAKLKDDTGLLQKLKDAADLDTAVAMAQEAGFDVSKADWLEHQAKETLELTDAELEDVAGGGWKEDFTKANDCNTSDYRVTGSRCE